MLLEPKASFLILSFSILRSIYFFPSLLPLFSFSFSTLFLAQSAHIFCRASAAPFITRSITKKYTHTHIFHSRRASHLVYFLHISLRVSQPSLYAKPPAKNAISLLPPPSTRHCGSPNAECTRVQGGASCEDRSGCVFFNETKHYHKKILQKRTLFGVSPHSTGGLCGYNRPNSTRPRHEKKKKREKLS